MVLTPPYSTPKLMKLGQTKAVGSFYQDHRRVRNVNTYLNDRGGYQDLDLVTVEGFHYLLFFRRSHASVQETQTHIWEDFFAQTFEFIYGCFGFYLVGTFHQGTDNEGLPSLIRLATDE